MPSVKLLNPSFTVFIHCKTRLSLPRTLVRHSVVLSLYPRFRGIKGGEALLVDHLRIILPLVEAVEECKSG